MLKEYENVFPALDIFTSLFSNGKSNFSIAEASNIINEAFEITEVNNRLKLQDILLLDGPVQVIKRLYSIGFFGVYNQQSSSYVFCHDGKEPDKDFTSTSRLLIHPCY